MWVDINGNKVKPNAMGKDLFYFFIDKSGSVVPEGSTTWKWLKNDDKAYWDSEGADLCNETGVGRGWGCSGSIFDNNLKVIYQ